MKLTQFLSTFHPASFAPKAVRRREITRSMLAAILVFVVLGLISVTVLVDSFGGRLVFGH
jgi:hypothetical protein